MAIMLGGAAAGAARRIKTTLMRIAAHNLGVPVEELHYADGDVLVQAAPERKMTWDQLIQIAHRRFHQLPPDIEPGLQASFVKSEEHTSELQSLMRISFTVFCLKKKH